MAELVLRKYQEENVNFMVKKRRVLLADQMGLGKTICSLYAADTLGDYPVLIVVPKVALYVWKGEIEKWFNKTATVYSGKPKERKKRLATFKKESIPYLITNYAFVPEMVEDVGIKFRTVICDEIHMAGLLNRKTKTFKYMRKLAKNSTNLFLVTGTPVRDTPDDLWGPLHLLRSRKFSSYWRFAHKYCVVINDTFGKTIERRPQNPKKFKKMLDGYMIRHLKRDVLSELPDKIRQVVRVDMTPKQKRIYQELEENMLVVFENGDLVATPNIVSKLIRLRQILVTPKMLGSNEEGGALKALRVLVQTEFDEGNSVAVFTSFRQAVPYIQEVLEKIDARVYKVTGGMRGSEINNQVQGFQKEKNNGALICVIKSGASFTAHKAPVGFFLGPEWSLVQNLQAEDRLHRIGQKDTVRIKYLLHSNTVDSLVAEGLNDKQSAVNWTLSPEKAARRLRRKYEK